MFEKEVRQLLQDALDKQPELFLIDFTISSDHKILVTIDGDKGVTLQDCMNISRGIEHNLDRDTVDFGLEVTSAGATAPLQIPRQYKKNIGRKLSVKLVNDKVEGELVSADDNKIALKWKTREPKPIGKGKVTVEKQQEILYTDIVEAKVMITF
ncbi:ribosome assembly cofactor RimP [Spongiivirga sp. MCCC 1A20706]|uniref:ribosome assembly cofactor RimP n=1 Tax=Spongiivirga sp. MCCC 1A20706 TaxID=3160963 RepID=UPI003977E1E8